MSRGWVSQLPWYTHPPSALTPSGSNQKTVGKRAVLIITRNVYILMVSFIGCISAVFVVCLVCNFSDIFLIKTL